MLLVAAGLVLAACPVGGEEPAAVAEELESAEMAAMPEAESIPEAGSAGVQAEVRMELEWEPTVALVRRAEVREVVDRLAAYGRIESARVSSGGEPSEVYGVFRELVGVASEGEVAALLRHESGVVRGYMMQRVVEAQRGSLAAVRPLLRDETAVEGQVGCMLNQGTIASRTVEALCSSREVPEVLEMLEVAAGEAVPDLLRARAVVCIARPRPERGVELARPMLGHSEGDVRRLAVQAHTVAGIAGSTGELEGMAADEDRGVRASVATAVARLGGRPAVVEGLLEDEDHYVRMIAGSAYVEMGRTERAVVERLLGDPEVRVRNGVAEAMARHGVLVELLEQVLLAPRVDGRIMQALAQREDAELAPMMRRLVAAESAYVRERATDWLGQHGDATDLTVLRGQLGGPSIGERRQAARALARHGDAEAVPLLEAMLRSDDNPHGRIAAAEALVAIRGEAAREAVAAAVAAEGTWARATLQEILDGLDGGGE